MRDIARTLVLFVVTAISELIGCYLSCLWIRQGRSAWLVAPAALSLGVFAWLLTLHPAATGRVYAAYGGVYVGMAVLWLRVVDGVRPNRWELLGASITLLGMAIIVLAPDATRSTPPTASHPAPSNVRAGARSGEPEL